MDISYVSENPSKRYSVAIRAAKTREALVEAIELYESVADDALRVARALTEQGFKDFRKGVAVVHKKQTDRWVSDFEERFGDIILPRKLLITTLLEDQYKAPWGTVVIRCEEEGWPMLK